MERKETSIEKTENFLKNDNVLQAKHLLPVLDLKNMNSLKSESSNANIISISDRKRESRYINNKKVEITQNSNQEKSENLKI